MNFEIQKGLVRETICGVEVLVATMEARKRCPYLMQLNSASAFVWDLLQEGHDTDEIVKRIEKEYGLSGKDAQEGLDTCLHQYLENHLIRALQSEKE